MLLNQLTKREKEAFVEFCVHTAEANGIVEIQELSMIGAYCKEMEINEHELSEVRELDEIYAIFTEADMTSKRIIFLETLGILYSDGSYDEKENEFLVELVKRLGLSNEEVANISGALNKYLDALKDVKAVVL